MSWTKVFPVFSEDKVEEFIKRATPEEQVELSEWFDIERIINAKEGKHLIVASLFWKNTKLADADLPQLTREILINAQELGLVSRYAPWTHYVLPLLRGASLVQEKRPDIVFRVYLAADLEFLVDDLVEAGCEVALMKGSSIRHNPGAMWRFLAFEEPGRWITVTDSDRAYDILADVERTEIIMESGLGCWRYPYIYSNLQHHDARHYRPIIACQFGVVGGYPVSLLMKAFLWHTKRGTMTNLCTIGETEGDGGQIPGSIWPDYGFDEWFLIAAMYPRLAPNGVLTFFPNKNAIASQWLAVDIEYVTWANPQSEILFFKAPNLPQLELPTSDHDHAHHDHAHHDHAHHDHAHCDHSHCDPNDRERRGLALHH